MKKIIAYLFLFFLVFPGMMKVGIMANYFIQYNRYVTELCENRDKPEMHCNGTCQLTQELTEASPDPQSPIVPSALQDEPVFFFYDGIASNDFYLKSTNALTNYLDQQTKMGFYNTPSQPPEGIIA